MKLLYDDEFAPITTGMGFMAAERKQVVDTYASWSAGLKIQLASEEVTGPLSEALTRLLPLTTHLRQRFLFVPTASSWVAYFDNWIGGTDASPVMAHMAKLLKSRTLSITAISEEREARREKGRRDAAVMFELWEPFKTDWLNLGRAIAVGKDSKWVFRAGGTAMPFEEPENYNKPKIKERFTIDMLDRYLRAMGIRAFDEDFYLPHGTRGVFLEKEGKPVSGTQEFTLEEAFARGS